MQRPELLGIHYRELTSNLTACLDAILKPMTINDMLNVELSMPAALPTYVRSRITLFISSTLNFHKSTLQSS
jgi:hypothetical protein